MHNVVAGAAEFSKLFPPARSAGFIYPPREALFGYTFVIHRSWIIFLFYKVNEIVPPRHIVKWNSYHISIFSDFFRKLLIHSPKIVDNSPVFPLFFCPLIVDNSLINRVPATPFLFFYAVLLNNNQPYTSFRAQSRNLAKRKKYNKCGFAWILRLRCRSAQDDGSKNSAAHYYFRFNIPLH